MGYPLIVQIFVRRELENHLVHNPSESRFSQARILDPSTSFSLSYPCVEDLEEQYTDLCQMVTVASVSSSQDNQLLSTGGASFSLFLLILQGRFSYNLASFFTSLESDLLDEGNGPSKTRRVTLDGKK